jgi:aerobic C4-dicarboxylate transport protein
VTASSRAGDLLHRRPRHSVDERSQEDRPLAIIPDIPIQSLALLLGIDKFMSECRALTNLIGNGVACIVISRSEGELDVDKLHEAMANPIALGEEMETSPA